MMEMPRNKLDEFAEICAKTANMRGNEWNKSAKAYAKTAMRMAVGQRVALARWCGIGRQAGLASRHHQKFLKQASQLSYLASANVFNPVTPSETVARPHYRRGFRHCNNGSGMPEPRLPPDVQTRLCHFSPQSCSSTNRLGSSPTGTGATGCR